MKRAYFAAGCFWCAAAAFRDVSGVESIVSGYVGGSGNDAVYEKVKSQETGHRETVCILYDETVTDWNTLFDRFLGTIDPFDGGGQFIDRGRSYSTAVFYTSEEEKAYAVLSLDRLKRESGREPAVSVEPFSAFYAAEEYHQDYDLKNPDAIRAELISSGRMTQDGSPSFPVH